MVHHTTEAVFLALTLTVFLYNPTPAPTKKSNGKLRITTGAIAIPNNADKPFTKPFITMLTSSSYR
jgi:hypothetical protein